MRDFAGLGQYLVNWSVGVVNLSLPLLCRRSEVKSAAVDFGGRGTCMRQVSLPGKCGVSFNLKVSNYRLVGEYIFFVASIWGPFDLMMTPHA